MCKREEEEKDAVVKRKDAEGAAGVEVAEEVGVLEGVAEDAGDEEAGEAKKSATPIQRERRTSMRRLKRVEGLV